MRPKPKNTNITFPPRFPASGLIMYGVVKMTSQPKKIWVKPMTPWVWDRRGRVPSSDGIARPQTPRDMLCMNWLKISLNHWRGLLEVYHDNDSPLSCSIGDGERSCNPNGHIDEGDDKNRRNDHWSTTDGLTWLAVIQVDEAPQWWRTQLHT